MKSRKLMPDLQDGSPMLFDRKKTCNLIFPLIAEFVLLSLIGTADTLMVAQAGASAVSAVSLVNTLNTVIVTIFSSLSIGGSVVISQLVGAGQEHEARQSARQLLFSTTVLALFLTLLCLIFRNSILRLLFPQVETELMQDMLTYFTVTALSYPFISIGTAAAAVFRVGGNSRLPMLIKVVANIVNIIGNAILIFGLHMGVLGAALPTLLSNLISGFSLCLMLRHRDFRLYTRHWLIMKPSWFRIHRMLQVAVPTVLENGLFDLGKLMTQAVISSAGTMALSANAIMISMESLSSKGYEGMVSGLMIMVGTCAGAGRWGEAREHIRRISISSFFALVSFCAAAILLVRPVGRFSGLSPEAVEMAFSMCLIVHIFKPFLCVPSFVLNSAMRSAGDVRYSMTMSICSMWSCRVLLCYLLFRFANQGIMAMWWGMLSDWTLRSLLNIIHYQSGRWMNHALVTRKG